MDQEPQSHTGLHNEDKCVINYISLNQEHKCIAVGTNKGYIIYSVEMMR